MSGMVIWYLMIKYYLGSEVFNIMPKISIVTSYYNRKKALLKTLKTLEKSQFKDFEFIIIDDASDTHQRIEGLAERFAFVKLTRIDPKDKYYINPCIPFNLGFSLATGDIVIIQSPECLHMGDILDFVVNNSKDNQYLVFSCYSLGYGNSIKLDLVDFSLPLVEFEKSITNTIGGFSDKGCGQIGRYDSWFVHPIHRHSYFNFLVSMPMKDLRDLGGFDERFAYGYAADDRELVSRIVKKNMDIKIIEHPFCIHQYHSAVFHDTKNHNANIERNNKLYAECIKSPHYKVKNSFLKEIK